MFFNTIDSRLCSIELCVASQRKAFFSNSTESRGWMDGWMHGYMDGWMDACSNKEQRDESRVIVFL